MFTSQPSSLATSDHIKAQFPRTLIEMLSTGQAIGRSRRVSFVGGSTLNNLYVLHALFKELDPKRTLEVGLACGTSALLFTSLFRARDGRGSTQHTAIDPFQGDLDDAGLHQIGLEGLDAYFRLLREPSSSALPRLLAEHEKFDLIYVDGSHLFEDVFIDVFYGARLLLQGGVIALDDSTWPDVAKVIRFIERNFSGRLKPLNVLDYRPRDAVTMKAKLARQLRRNQMTAFRLIDDPVRPWASKLKHF